MLSPWRLLWQWWLLRRLNENWKLFLWRDIFRSRLFCSLPHSHISSCWLQVRQRKQTGRRDVTVQHSRRSPNVNRSTTEWNRCPCSLQSRRTTCPVMHEHALPFTVRATTRHRIRPPGGDIETSPPPPPFPNPFAFRALATFCSNRQNLLQSPRPDCWRHRALYYSVRRRSPQVPIHARFLHAAGGRAGALGRPSDNDERPKEGNGRRFNPTSLQFTA